MKEPVDITRSISGLQEIYKLKELFSFQTYRLDGAQHLQIGKFEEMTPEEDFFRFHSPDFFWNNPLLEN